MRYNESIGSSKGKEKEKGVPRVGKDGTNNNSFKGSPLSSSKSKTKGKNDSSQNS